MTQAALAGKLLEAGKSIGRIAKDGTNDFHKYAYVTEGAVMDAVGTELDRLGVATIVSVNHVENHYDGATVFTTVRGDLTYIDIETGDQIVAGFGGTGTDKGDKGYYKAVTGGVKYAFLKSLRIPTGDDPEVDTAERKAAAPAPKPSGPTPPPAEKPGGLSPAQITKLKASLGSAGLATDGQKAAFTVFALGYAKKSKEMTGSEMDKILTALTERADLVANAQAVV